jgi:tetratricopeptide (TPR) repeat protein
MSDLTGNSRPTPKQDFQSGAPYKKGDFIGQDYEVYGILGKGGCGIVYLVYSHEGAGVFALKTFLDEFLADQEVRQRFQKEANIWVELGNYPYLVRAYFVEEISGRLYVAVEYIAPNEQGLNSLEGYLRQQPPGLAQSLRWAIQICHGMEYAYSKGVRAHRDLKPANIMITQDKTAKITDFGLAGVLTESPAIDALGLGAGGLSGQTMLGTGFGTPTHMAPEQFDNAALCDERSDIYSFGVVLYQMAAGGRLPFPVPMGADWQEEMRQLHRESPVPRLDSPLFPIIQRCLEKSPEKRYQTFKEVRTNLEPLLLHQTGEVIIPPQLNELEAWEWVNKGVSLGSLGRYEEAIHCCEKALALDPRNVNAWNNKGISLSDLGRYEEALRCYDKALELDPCYTLAWTNKGSSLDSLERHEEALRCCDKALELDPHYGNAWTNKGVSLGSLGRNEEAILSFDKALALDPHNAATWNNKGSSLSSLGRFEEALGCLDKALALDPRNVNAWNNKGVSLNSLGHFEEALRCCDKALELDPRYTLAWTNKGNSLHFLGHHEEAIRCYDKALELDPRYTLAWTNKGSSLDSLERHEDAIRCLDKILELDPRDAAAWYKKGISLDSLGRPDEAILCYDKSLELDPRSAAAWTNKGLSLHSLGRDEEAIQCFDKALELDPRSAVVWFGKALAEDVLSKWREAVHSYQQFLALAAVQQYAKPIEYARKRLRELGE